MSGFLPVRFSWLFCALAAACSSGAPEDAALPSDDDDVSGGQTGEEDFGCLPVRRESFALDAVSPLGFSAEGLLLALGPRQSRTLTYEGGVTTALELGLALRGSSADFAEREFRSDDSGREIAGAEIGVDCSDVLELDLTLTFETADGAFDETWPVKLVADTATTARVFHPFDPESLSGSFRLERGSYDDVTANLVLSFVGMTWSGALDGEGEQRGDGANADSAVSSTGIPIATF